MRLHNDKRVNSSKDTTILNIYAHNYRDYKHYVLETIPRSHMDLPIPTTEPPACTDYNISGQPPTNGILVIWVFSFTDNAAMNFLLHLFLLTEYVFLQDKVYKCCIITLFKSS